MTKYQIYLTFCHTNYIIAIGLTTIDLKNLVFYEEIFMNLIAQDLHKRFGSLEVLKGVSFSVESGKTFAFLGRNGAGKSTTIRIILDVFKADKGSLLLDGKPFIPNQDRIGYLPEEKVLYPKKRIIDQLVYFATLKGMKEAQAKKACFHYLERLGLLERKNKQVSDLSKGNQQKLQMIIALVHNPDILIFDEPFSGLDPVNAEILKELVREEVKKGKIVFLSSHQMNYVEEFCTDMAILNGGKVVLSGNISDIRKSYTRDKLKIISDDIDKINLEYAQNIVNATDESQVHTNSTVLQFSDIAQAQHAMRTITSKYTVDEIGIVEPTLNEIFVEHTKDSV